MVNTLVTTGKGGFEISIDIVGCPSFPFRVLLAFRFCVSSVFTVIFFVFIICDELVIDFFASCDLLPVCSGKACFRSFHDYKYR